MTRYALIDDATGATLATAECPFDLFDAEEADDAIADACIRAFDGEQHVPVGGGAAPLVWIENWGE